MDTIEILNMKVVDVLNRPVKYLNRRTLRKKTGRILRIDEAGCTVIDRRSVTEWHPWDKVEWQK